eukprot:4679282-Heterocapsa_arctica.AAC.1
MHGGRGRRAFTLRQRVKTWLKAEKWFYARFLVTWPLCATQVVDYLEDRALEVGCGRTTFRSFLGALAFIEAAGCVPEEARLSRSPIIENTVADLEVEVASGQVRERRVAHRYIAIVIVALEFQ